MADSRSDRRPPAPRRDDYDRRGERKRSHSPNDRGSSYNKRPYERNYSSSSNRDYDRRNDRPSYNEPPPPRRRDDIIRPPSPTAEMQVDHIPPPPSDDTNNIPPPPSVPPPDTDAPAPPPVKRVPLSVEELLKKKEADSQKQEKPVFLSKEERAKLALERRQAEANAIRQKQEDARASAKTLDDHQNGGRMDYSYDDRRDDRRRGGGDRYDDRNGRGGDSRYDSRDRDRDGERDRDSGRDRNRDTRDNRDLRAASADSENDGIPFNEKELVAIREKYMGTLDKKRRHIRKMNEKKFVFDWNAEEDTSKDINPIYIKRHDAQLFGRGHIAGIDIKEQKKERSGFYNSLIEARRNVEEVERAREMEENDAKRARQVAFDERHWSDKPLEEMKERDWRIFREDFNISTKGGILPNPIRTWDEAEIPDRIKKVIISVGYTEPSPIQRVSIPIGLQNRDLIGIAETGSGKTASFVIPLLSFIMELPALNEDNASLGPYAIILAPTRELAQQIEQETIKFATPLGFICVSIVGGHALEEQSFSLRNGAHIVIATPGRLKDCLDRRILVLAQCSYVVMDEADRMIDMGFEADVNAILDALPVSNTKPDTDDAENSEAMQARVGDIKYRQTSMFSATMPPAVERLAKKYLRRPAIVTIGTAGQAVDKIEQRVEFVSNEERKKNRLLELLEEHHDPPIIVFVNTQKGCDILSKALEKLNYSVATLHGGKSQEQREQGLADLKARQKDILVATDVAGRGLDVKNVSMVVNYDMAKNIEAYTHRIGRTGRAGKNGLAITFLTHGDSEVFYDLKMMLLKSPNSKVPRELSEHEAAQNKGVDRRPKKKE
ncbi:hypothetical protein SmJEL517_g03455 [Synchytrium microbalum]|uniref:RNA helicase n=1 Tax=Synchytrium microbalum TaxID=1806994 RepID=A0A507C3V0_9FUNG|nr:uncharacterized protein SmJEL517_g03455 [Synchytrium microbalum]TPX33759.1 hypothetical protein SmJEL517_g03455 [Synchytrium microbalum]